MVNTKHVQEAVEEIRTNITATPTTAIVLGSGLGDITQALSGKNALSYSKIPHFPQSNVTGHAGQFVSGSLGGISVFIMSGRVHAYEGYTAEEVVFPIRVLSQLGISKIVLTNAAGAINTSFYPGDLMLVKDHINMTGLNPLIGTELIGQENYFTDLTDAYDRKLQINCIQAVENTGLKLREGTYVGVLGPSFETPAEIRMMRTLGADAVGMSTVLETIAANRMGVKILGLSCITNMAAGILHKKITHSDVLLTGGQLQDKLLRLLKSFLPKASDD